MTKYGAKRTQANGIWFDSQAEARCYDNLLLLQHAGKIKDLVLQPAFKLSCGGKPIMTPSGRQQAVYKADFQYFDCDKGKTVVVDVKGFDTKISQLKRAIVEAEHGVKVEIVK